MLPVPEVVREMADKVDRTAENVLAISMAVEKIAADLRALKDRDAQIARVSVQVDAINGDLAIAKDQLSWLCAAARAVNEPRNPEVPSQRVS